MTGLALAAAPTMMYNYAHQAIYTVCVHQDTAFPVCQAILLIP